MEHTDPASPSSDDASCSRVREVITESTTRTSADVGPEERRGVSISVICGISESKGEGSIVWFDEHDFDGRL